MKSIVGPLAGGVLVAVVASLLGVAHNAVRSNPIKLIQSVEVVSTANHGGAKAATPDSAGGSEIPLPEGAISLEQMKALYDEGMAIVIDARSPGEFEKGHIPGALNIPYDRLPEYLETLEFVPKSETVVCYCRSVTCDFSDHLATELKLMGYEKVLVYTGGWDEWTEADYPQEGGTE